MRELALVILEGALVRLVLLAASCFVFLEDRAHMSELALSPIHALPCDPAHTYAIGLTLETARQYEGFD